MVAMAKPCFLHTSPSTVSFILLAAALTALTFTKLTSRSPSSPSSMAPAAEFRLLIGVLTVPNSYARRHLVRHAYALQSNLTASGARIDVRFVFCNLTTEEQRVLVAMEILLYDDIIILDCAENMDNGKTYAYFSAVPRMFDESPYDFVMKTDDDTYFRLDNLAASLRGLPREDVYYGFRTPCHNRRSPTSYMSGMGYALSWDLVEWIATAETARGRQRGPEDLTTGAWLREGGRGWRVFDMGAAMYDYMEEGDRRLCSRHELVAETIAVHKLKSELRWARTLKYFNVTAALKPSKLYHI